MLARRNLAKSLPKIKLVRIPHSQASKLKSPEMVVSRVYCIYILYMYSQFPSTKFIETHPDADTVSAFISVRCLERNHPWAFVLLC